MAKFVPLSRQQHGHKTWKRPDSYRFAAQDAMAPSVGAELATAAVNMPVAFTRQSDRYQLVALLSLQPKRNLFVGPDGKWIGDYVPAVFRGYPFRLLRVTGDDKMVLAIDEESPFIKDGPGEEIFFDEGGHLSKAVTPISQFLQEAEKSRNATAFGVKALTEASVIVPWEIMVRNGDKTVPVGGVFRIDEAALNNLDTEAFEILRKSGALPIAYAQMISMSRLAVLQRLVALHNKRAKAAREAAQQESDIELLGNLGNDLLRF